MPSKLYKQEEIVTKLDQVDVLTSQGHIADAIRSIGVTSTNGLELMGWTAPAERH
jgi:hypothetical protein